MVKLLKNRTVYTHVVGLLVILASFTPWLSDSISYGQMIKQTSTVQIIEGYTSRPLVKGFPTRLYNEIFHRVSVPWIEEIPLYHFLSAILKKTFALSETLAAKWISLLSYLSLIFSLFLIGRLKFKEDPLAKYLIIATFLSFPIFRVYATQAMPEMLMMQFCSWAVYFTFCKKRFPTIAVLTLASISKYYALFFTGGIFLYWNWQDRKLFKLKALFLSKNSLMIWVPFVCVSIFLTLIFKLGINNPIQDYAQMGMSHSFSLTALLSSKFFSRGFTWIFLKNSNILNGFLAIVALVFYVKESLNRPSLFIFLTPQIIFACIFAKTFIIHDYYAIQIAK